MTTRSRFGSQFFLAMLAPMITVGCGTPSQADPAPAARSVAVPASAAPRHEPGAAAETCLGVTDTGIWSDLDDQVQIALPPVPPDRVTATVDGKRQLLVLSIDGFPRKSYPLTGTSTLVVGMHSIALRPGDRAELAPLLTAERTRAASARSDADRDGIPDALDILIGAKKTVLNGDAYTEGYVTIGFPMGDVPREIGVCTDVVIRAVRNAGVDLQKALHDDIKRAPKAYPMVRGRANPHIDQRRVKTLLPYFKRHWEAHSARLDDPADPLRPGDVIFMDTFPSKAGPDHIGILSDRVDDQGLPLVINNWTTGTVTAEMDLLTFVPVLHRFRLPGS